MRNQLTIRMPMPNEAWSAIHDVRVDITWYLRIPPFTRDDRKLFKVFVAAAVNTMLDKNVASLVAPSAQMRVNVKEPEGSVADWLALQGAPKEATWALFANVRTKPESADFAAEIRRRVETLARFAVPATDVVVEDILDGDPASNMVIGPPQSP